MELVARSGIDKDLYENFVLGCAFPEGTQGMLMAKGVGILADLPKTMAGSVVNRFCGSAMDAIHQVSRGIETNDYSCGIAGGVEDMFGVPMGGFNPIFHQIYMKKNII